MSESTAYPMPSSTPHLRLVDERATYDAGPAPERRHFTSVNDDVVDAILDRLSPEALGIYVYLERRAGAQGSCQISYTRMLDDLHMRKPTLIYQLQNLAREGFIQITTDPNARRTHAANIYTLPQHRRGASTEASTQAGSVSDQASTQASTEAGQSGDHKVDTSRYQVENDDPFPNADEAIMPRLMREAICEARGVTSLSVPMKKQIDGIVASLIDMGANNFDIPNVLFWAQHHDFWGDAHGTKVSKGYSLKQLPTIFEQWVNAGRPRRRISVFAGAPAPEAR